MTRLARRRRHPAAVFVLIALALLVTGGAYAAASAISGAQASPAVASATQVEEGERLYLEGCSSCHGMQGEGSAEDRGPSLIGVGAASVHFQVATGRMPLAQPGAQAERKAPIYAEDEVAALAAYIATLGPGPAIPTAEQLDTSNADIAVGAELYRANCSQCHQAAGKGGALTQGKYAPGLMDSDAQVIYEAMVTGPQNMPVFANTTLSEEEKRDVIAFIEFLQTSPDPGGAALGRLGPVAEGLFLWIGAMFALVLVAVWVGARVR